MFRIRHVSVFILISLFALILWVGVQSSELAEQQRLNNCVVDGILNGRFTNPISASHYETELVKRRVCGVINHSVSVVAVYGATKPLENEAFSKVLRLQFLRKLRLTGEILSANDIESLQRMERLRHLDLAISRVDGGARMINGPRLTSLRLNSCEISLESIFALIHSGTIHELQITNCTSDSNKMVLDGLVAELPHLQVLDIRWTRISMSELKRISQLDSLRDLQLAGVEVDDDLITTVATSRSISTLGIYNGSVTDLGIKALRNCKSLRTLHIYGCAGVSTTSIEYLVTANPFLVVNPSAIVSSGATL